MEEVVMSGTLVGKCPVCGLHGKELERIHAPFSRPSRASACQSCWVMIRQAIRVALEKMPYRAGMPPNAAQISESLRAGFFEAALEDLGVRALRRYRKIEKSAGSSAFPSMRPLEGDRSWRELCAYLKGRRRYHLRAK